MYSESELGMTGSKTKIRNEKLLQGFYVIATLPYEKRKWYSLITCKRLEAR